MKNARTAEWLLRQTISREKAAAEVGDLLELRPAKGSVWFWLAIVQLLARQSWRHALAFAAAFYGGAWSLEALVMRLYGIHSSHRLDHTFWWSQPADGALSLVAVTSLMSFLFAAIRFGIADRMAKTAAVLAISTWMIVYFWWQPVLLCVSVSISVIFGLLASRRRSWRPILLLTPLLSLVLLVLWFSAGFMSFAYQKHVAGPLVGTAELQAHPSIKWMTFALYIAVTLGFTWACTFVHRRIAPVQNQEALEHLGDSDSVPL